MIRIHRWSDTRNKGRHLVSRFRSIVSLNLASTLWYSSYFYFDIHHTCLVCEIEVCAREHSFDHDSILRFNPMAIWSVRVQLHCFLENDITSGNKESSDCRGRPCSIHDLLPQNLIVGISRLVVWMQAVHTIFANSQNQSATNQIDLRSCNFLIGSPSLIISASHLNCFGQLKMSCFYCITPSSLPRVQTTETRRHLVTRFKWLVSLYLASTRQTVQFGMRNWSLC